MSNQESPKPKKPRRKRLNVTSREKWEKIIKGVKKIEVPITVLESITVNLIDGTHVHVDIKELLADGSDEDEVQRFLNEKLEQLDQYIHDVDFYVSVDDVAKVLQPITDNFLKDL